MLLSSIFQIILTINAIAARHIHTSLGGLTKLLDEHPNSPIFAIVRTGAKHNLNNLRTKDENIQHKDLAALWDSIIHVTELQKGFPKLERTPEVQRTGIYAPNERNKKYKKEFEHEKVTAAKRAIGYWLQKLQVKDLTTLEQLRQKLALMKEKYKQPLRSKAKEFGQKSNKDVFQYIQEQHFRSESKKKSRLRGKGHKDNMSTRGPDAEEDSCGSRESSTKAGMQWDEPDHCNNDCTPKKRKTSKPKTTKKKQTKNTGFYSTKIHRDIKNIYASDEGSTKAGHQCDEPSDKCGKPKSGSTKGPKYCK